VTERVRVDRIRVHVRGAAPGTGQALAAELRTSLRPALEAELARPGAALPDGRVAATARAVADGVRRARP
jgi:hypothetical protein